MIDEALLKKFGEHPFELHPSTMASVYHKLDKSTYDTFIYSCDGHLIAVKGLGSIHGDKPSLITKMITYASPNLGLDHAAYDYDLPDFLAIDFDQDTLGILSNAKSLLDQRLLPKRVFDYPGISFDYSKKSRVEPFSKTYPKGKGVANFQGNGLRFLIKYNEKPDPPKVVSRDVYKIEAFDYKDIFGDLMIPRLLAWGYRKGIVKVLESSGTTLDEAISKTLTPSLSAVAGRLRRFNPSLGADYALDMLLKLDSVQPYLPEIVRSAEDVLPESKVAELKCQIAQNGTLDSERGKRQKIRI